MGADMMALQAALAGLGYSPGPLDGIWGAKTRAATEAILAANGRPGGASPHRAVTELPWIAEGRRMLGMHEVHNRTSLMAWLRRDGKTLGDPSKLPWCGDFVETCIRIALPSEQFQGALAMNPYWARNWLQFGRSTEPTYGAVMVFERGSGGHVGFAVGEEGAYFQILGGNQSNSVSIAKVEKSRLLGARWPSTFDRQPIYLPRMVGGKITTNEA